MGKIIEPKITIPDIQIEADSNSEYSANRIMREWGKSIPMIKINDYVLGVTEIVSCKVNVKLNSLPTFDITISDESFKIRESLKNQLDKIVLFLGYNKQYVKFNGLVTSTDSKYSSNISLTGIFYQEKLFETKQQLWSETSIKDILTDICSTTNMGLFTFDNNYLTNVIDTTINPNTKHIDFIDYLIQQYTDNIYMFDTFGYLHVGNVENILKQPTDKYSINPNTGEPIDETDMVFRTYKRTDYDELKDDKKILVDYYTVVSNFSLQHLKTASEYIVKTDDSENITNIESNVDLGFGIKTDNTFSGFNKNKLPYYNERVNKILYGNLIKLKLRNICYEIVPFSVVELELNLPSSGETGKGPHLDTTHSGKHMVVGYEYTYRKKRTSEQNNIEQIIYLI